MQAKEELAQAPRLCESRRLDLLAGEDPRKGLRGRSPGLEGEDVDVAPFAPSVEGLNHHREEDVAGELVGPLVAGAIENRLQRPHRAAGGLTGPHAESLEEPLPFSRVRLLDEGGEKGRGAYPQTRLSHDTAR